MLQEWLANYKAQWKRHKNPSPASEAIELRKAALASVQKELGELEKQKERLHDLLERGIYDEATYLERSQNLADRIEVNQAGLANALAALDIETKRANAQQEIIPNVESVLKLYNRTNDINKKNALLKSVVESAVYRKEKNQVGEEFELVISPKLPPSTDIMKK